MYLTHCSVSPFQAHIEEKIEEIEEGEGDGKTDAELDVLDGHLRRLEEAYDPYREAVLRLLGGGGALAVSSDPPRAFGINEHIIEDYVWFKLVAILNARGVHYEPHARAPGLRVFGGGAAPAAGGAGADSSNALAELVVSLRKVEGELGREPLKLVTLLLLTLEFEYVSSSFLLFAHFCLLTILSNLLTYLLSFLFF